MTTFNKFTDLKEHLKLEDLKLTYKGEPIRLQLPPLYSPFGIKSFAGKFNSTSCSLDLSIRGYDEEGKRPYLFKKWYRELEETLFAGTLQNPDQFNSCVKHPNPEYAPLFRIKVPTTDGAIDALVWKEDSQENEKIYGTANGVFKGTTVIAIIVPSPYTLPNGMWGISWKLDQMRIFNPKRIRGCMFQD